MNDENEQLRSEIRKLILERNAARATVDRLTLLLRGKEQAVVEAVAEAEASRVRDKILRSFASAEHAAWQAKERADLVALNEYRSRFLPAGQDNDSPKGAWPTEDVEALQGGGSGRAVPLTVEIYAHRAELADEIAGLTDDLCASVESRGGTAQDSENARATARNLVGLAVEVGILTGRFDALLETP